MMRSLSSQVFFRSDGDCSVVGAVDSDPAYGLSFFGSSTGRFPVVAAVVVPPSVVERVDVRGVSVAVAGAEVVVSVPSAAVGCGSFPPVSATISHPTSYWVPKHSSRVFVPHVDMVSGVGTDRAAEAGPSAQRYQSLRGVVTNLAVLDFAADGRLRLASVHPGVTVDRLEHKLGIKASDTAQITFEDCRVPKENLLGDPEVRVDKGFAGAMQTFDNTRPLVAGMAVGCARAALEEIRRLLEEAGLEIDYDKPATSQPAAVAKYLELEADWEAAYLLTLRAAWMADNKMPNTKEASMSKAKAGRTGSAVTLGAVELAGTYGYSERSFLEKWSRDSKILDIFEGTQQIQQLVIARRVLDLNSSQLK